jgi:hypothetical protein
MPAQGDGTETEAEAAEREEAVERGALIDFESSGSGVLLLIYIDT